MNAKNTGCLYVIFNLLGITPDGKEEGEEKLPYKKRDDFLSDAELSFYKTLYLSIPDAFTICPKVSLSDIFFVSTSDRSSWTRYNNKINKKHVDFLLCEKVSMNPVCGIELDDSSHSKQKRVERDRFVDKVFETVGLKLLRFPVKKGYGLPEIREKLNEALKPAGSVREQSDDDDGKTEALEAPVCKKCGITMVLRQAKRGERKGQKFYGCPNYPRCKEMVNLSESGS